jgi:hypothetical protein
MDWVVWTAFNFSIVGFVALSVASVCVTPPPRFPHLWQLLSAVVSAAHFVGFAAYFNWVQIDLFRSARKRDQLMARGKKRQ